MPGMIPDTRKLMYCLLALFFLSAPDGRLAAQLLGDTTPRYSGQSLINALKKGGYVIYFRHGETSNTGEKDVEDKDLDNCAIQRNLSEAGQVQTRAIGAAFKTLQIPIGQMYSSPYCRCMETAKNIFGQVHKSSALHFAIHLDNTQRANATAQLLELLGTPPQPGTNTVLVSHTANLQEAVGIWPKPEGVAHIFKPENAGQFSYVGVMLPDEWRHEGEVSAQGTSKSGVKGWFATVKQWFSWFF